MTEYEFSELSAGYALNALSPEDETAYLRELAAHPEWAHHAEGDLRVAALLAEGVPDAAPSPGVRTALLARIVDVPPAADPAAVPAPRRRWTRGIFALAASLVLLVAVGAGVVQLTGVFSPPAAVVALDAIQQAPDAQEAVVPLTDGGAATAHWSASTGRAVLVVDGLASLPADSTYELWFVRGEAGAVSAGTFEASDGGATALLAGTMQPGDVIAVTVEQAGGSPNGVPTSTPILAIQTA